MVTHQLQVERRTGKVRRPETDVLPLCHATNTIERIDKYNIRIDKYLDTLLANQPISDGEATDRCQKGAPQDGGLPELL